MGEVATVSAESQVEAVNAAIDAYIQALLRREHGGVAQSQAFDAICEALNRNAIREFDDIRLGRSQPRMAQNG